MLGKLKYIDVFAGAGGLSEGFIQAGFKPVAHVEYDKAACFTLKTRLAFHYLKNTNKLDIYYSYLHGEISRSELYTKIPQKILDSVIQGEIGKENSIIFNRIDNLTNGQNIDLIIGGPPCQAYSVVGRAPLKNKINDDRKTLYIHYGRFLKKYNPQIFVFENVPGLLTASNGQYYKNLQTYYKRLGYTVEAQVLRAHDYGVIQHRKRVIIIGWKNDLNFSYPDIPKIKTKYYRDKIFSDLPAINPGESSKIQNYSAKINDYLKKTSIRNGIDFVTQHITRPHNDNDLKIYELAIKELEKGIRLKNSHIPDNIRTQNNVTDFLDRFKVVGDVPHTMIAHIAKDGHHFIHPDITQLRSISVREAARIQSFPDDYYFEGLIEKSLRSAAFRQIG
ncbi:MAG: DNA cytosine methyltransferase, partial [Candidatus Marinimicrobia bacterium]|nr:DNA cytosine methyltransferase [Candidatus Neomarinimicrobiota bacterium]